LYIYYILFSVHSCFVSSYLFPFYSI
jgi:hypothetical protein